MKKTMKALLVLGLVTASLVPLKMASAAEVFKQCVVLEVAAINNRVHVRCSNDLGGGIFYVAAPNTDSDMANRLLMLGTAAVVNGKDLYLTFDPADNSGGAWGCAATDCRPALAATLRR